MQSVQTLPVILILLVIKNCLSRPAEAGVAGLVELLRRRVRRRRLSPLKKSLKMRIARRRT